MKRANRMRLFLLFLEKKGKIIKRIREAMVKGV
jgi:hypothetical protein